MFLDRTGADLGNALSYFSKRQEVIAANIANLDTPGYKAQDVEQPANFSGILAGFDATVRETTGLTVRNDGNNVNIDREARSLAENTMKFNLATQMLRGELRGVKSAIEEGRS